MTASLLNRLIGLAVFSTVTIASFHTKLIWDHFISTPLSGSPLTAFALLLIMLAIIASVGTWQGRPWSYALSIVLTARENIDAVYSYYSQPANFRYTDIISIEFAGIPLLVGMVAAFVLLITHSRERRSRLSYNQMLPK